MIRITSHNNLEASRLVNIAICDWKISICILQGLRKHQKIIFHFHMHILLPTSGIHDHVVVIEQGSSIDLQSNQIM